MDEDRKILKIKPTFNSENVWDNKTDLYDIYFSETIENNKHYIVHLESKESDFEKAVTDLKEQYYKIS